MSQIFYGEYEKIKKDDDKLIVVDNIIKEMLIDNVEKKFNNYINLLFYIKNNLDFLLDRLYRDRNKFNYLFDKDFSNVIEKYINIISSFDLNEFEYIYVNEDFINKIKESDKESINLWFLKDSFNKYYINPNIFNEKPSLVLRTILNILFTESERDVCIFLVINISVIFKNLEIMQFFNKKNEFYKSLDVYNNVMLEDLVNEKKYYEKINNMKEIFGDKIEELKIDFDKLLEYIVNFFVEYNSKFLVPGNVEAGERPLVLDKENVNYSFNYKKEQFDKYFSNITLLVDLFIEKLNIKVNSILNSYI